MTADNLIPATDKWQFDQAVTDVFPQMLENSIPDYHEMRRLVLQLGNVYIPASTRTIRATVVDLGASRGDGIVHYAESQAKVFAIDNSAAMCKVMRERFKDYDNVEVMEADLRNLIMFPNSVDLVQSVLTLQFVPIEDRLRVMEQVHRMLKPGGVFLFVEKVIGSTSKMNGILESEYYAMKRANGYSTEAIFAKRNALQHVMTPLTVKWNEDLLRQAGFTEFEPFWRNLNFCGWIAVK